jgi:hypothetical protein
MVTIFSAAVMGFIGLCVLYGFSRFILWLQGKAIDRRMKKNGKK